MVLTKTVANDCGRLRLRTVGQHQANTPLPPDPQSETGTLATHSGKNQSSFYTEKLVRKEISVDRDFCTKKLLHTETFKHRSLAQRNFYTEELLRTEAGTQRGFFTQKLWHTEELLYVNFYTNKFYSTQRTLHKEAFYIQKLLHTEAATPRNFSTEKNIHRGTFMHGSFHAQTRPHTHTEAFIHRNFHTEKSLHIFYHLSCFMINQHLSSSYLSVHDLVVNSLLLFFGAAWSFSFHVAPCSVRPGFVLAPLQRVKLN